MVVWHYMSVACGTGTILSQPKGNGVPWWSLHGRADEALENVEDDISQDSQRTGQKRTWGGVRDGTMGGSCGLLSSKFDVTCFVYWELHLLCAACNSVPEGN